MTTTKATCPVCQREVQVKTDGTLHRHRQLRGSRLEPWECQGSGAPPLGPWPRQHSIIPTAG